MAIVASGSDAALLAVADGMGGIAGSGQAAAIAVDAIAGIASLCIDDPARRRALIIDAVELANRRILDLGTGAATTLAVVEIAGGCARSYHVGDSEILIFGQRGRVKLRSVPHSPVGFAYHSGMIDEDQAIAHPDRHIVSNALGMRDMRIEIGSPIPIAPNDTILVCSDGLVDNLRFSEIADGLRTGRLDRALARVAAVATERMQSADAGQPGKPDDLSIIAYRRRPGAALLRRLSR
jgi:serine/threonine protein phosphatase PrpC